MPHVSAVTTLNDTALAATVAHTSFEAQSPSTRFRLYAEGSGDFFNVEPLSKQTAVAFANPSNVPVVVRMQLAYLNGQPGPAGTLQIPASGQAALYLNQVPGFENLPQTFQGVLNVTTDSPAGIVGTGGLALWSDRGGFVFTTTSPIVENAGGGPFLVFPHIAEGGGYITRFILLSRHPGQPVSGTLHFIDQQGLPYDLTLQ
jgi:hypothetical protein